MARYRLPGGRQPPPGVTSPNPVAIKTKYSPAKAGLAARTTV